MPEGGTLTWNSGTDSYHYRDTRAKPLCTHLHTVTPKTARDSQIHSSIVLQLCVEAGRQDGGKGRQASYVDGMKHAGGCRRQVVYYIAKCSIVSVKTIPGTWRRAAYLRSTGRCRQLNGSFEWLLDVGWHGMGWIYLQLIGAIILSTYTFAAYASYLRHNIVSTYAHYRRG